MPYTKENWCFPCDCKMCVNGSCGAGLLAIHGLLIAACFATRLWIVGVLCKPDSTNCSNTLSDEMCHVFTDVPTVLKTLQAT